MSTSSKTSHGISYSYKSDKISFNATDVREKLRQVISRFDLHLALNKTKGTKRWIYSSKMLWGEWVNVAPDLLSEFPTLPSIQQKNLKDIGLSWKDTQAYQHTVKYTNCLALGHNPPSTPGDINNNLAS